MRLFIAPVFISLAALIAVWWWGGLSALFLAAALAVLEVTLSFDNAVVNAKVLAEMTPVWQRRFLTWGILLSVFGTRLVLPIFIVSIVAWVSPYMITVLALYNPEEYSRLLLSADAAIKAFGGAFLLMVSLKYFFNVGKRIHWFAPIERHLVKWGRVEAIEIALALIGLLGISYISDHSVQTILQAGIIGIVLFTFTEGIAHGLGVEAKGVARSGAMLFAYLNILDSAFSLDGVIGAFALTTSLPIIVVGLGIGAYFVRSLTVYLVRAKTLQSLVYLEHGAHWAIFGLALTMFAGLVVHVPEIVIATIGLGFIVLAYFSSRRALRTPEIIDSLS
ncbi:MAG: Uncharacterized protein G01um101456_541 [Parcubacteria group bacterium Gr01-1014_56]|nr:MAG: Uncharacterized protein G01um101456_541 [Parcubacteria group bacterium Gr01-1014_56]